MKTRRAAGPALTVVRVPAMCTEDVLVAAGGDVYTGTKDGSVWRVRDEGARLERVGTTGGHPLGLEFLSDGRILVCDTGKGMLLAMETVSGATEVLTDLVNGERMVFCNNAAVAADGTIWFSDASRFYGQDMWKAEFAENTGSGRLLRRDPDGSVSVVLDGLRLANGVALAADESFVVVAESAGRTIVRRWLSGPRAGQTEHFASDLPGYPDNIARGSDGLFWVAIPAPKSPVVEWIMTGPMLVRRAAWRLPEPVQPGLTRSARVMAFDDAGTVVHDRSFDASSFHMVTGVRERDGRVWVGSFREPAIAFFDV